MGLLALIVIKIFIIIIIIIIIIIVLYSDWKYMVTWCMLNDIS